MDNLMLEFKLKSMDNELMKAIYKGNFILTNKLNKINKIRGKLK